MADGGGRVPARGRPAPRRRGQQPVYSQDVADEICLGLARGLSLREVCDGAHMPSEATVRGWAQDDRGPGFAAQYTRARELGFHSIAESILELGTGEVTGPDGYVDNGEIQRLRLLSENRKWFLSKLMPRQFGDKVTQEIVGDADQPLITRIELVPVDPRPARTIDHEPDDK